MSQDRDDKKVKELLDPATRADLERWFGLPSFEQLAEQGIRPAPPPEDPEVAAVRKRRAEAIAAIDPAMLEAHRLRVESLCELIKPRPAIEVRIDPSITAIDLAMIDRQHQVAEPREVELPSALRDDLRECTPQALLRDLHRPETTFEKVFEIVDIAAEQRIDIVAAVAHAMTTSTKLPPLGGTPFQEVRALLVELRQERRRPWSDIKMPNRRVTE